MLVDVEAICMFSSLYNSSVVNTIRWHVNSTLKREDSYRHRTICQKIGSEPPSIT